VGISKVGGCLEGMKMKTMAEYVQIRWQTIAVYVATQPILQECRQGEQQRGAVPHH
jgi:hypothetical protein